MLLALLKYAPLSVRRWYLRLRMRRATIRLMLLSGSGQLRYGLALRKYTAELAVQSLILRIQPSEILPLQEAVARSLGLTTKTAVTEERRPVPTDA